MFRVNVILNTDIGTRFIEALPTDDPQTVIWVPDNKKTLTVEKYVDTAADADAVRDQWQATLASQGRPEAGIESAPVREADWTTDWRSHFQRERITDRLLVCPAWDTYREQPGEWVVRIDPGMSFGTGQHGTTRSCLRFIADCRARRHGRPRFLDIGCGSGIISIAAALMDFSDVTAIDIEKQAIYDTRANSERNCVTDRVDARQNDLTQFQPANRYDVVAANLLADTLMVHATTISGLVRQDPPGDLMISGILQDQYDAVRSIYQARGFTEIDVQDDGAWRSGWLRRQ